MSDQQSPVTPLELTMKVGQKLSELIHDIHDKYSILIDINTVIDEIVYSDDNGDPTIRVISRATGAVIWEFKFRSKKSADDEFRTYVTNPKAFLYDDVIKNFGVLINSAEELDFLNDVKIDVRVDSSGQGGGLSFALMTLLNNYGIGTGWSCNPSSGNSTAYFILRYLGSGAKAPGVYNFNRNSERIAVVELLVSGEYKTYALIVG